MGLFERTATCEGCGKEFTVSPALSIGRIRRCSNCPPAPEAPALQEQLWELAQAVKDCERRERLQDRLDLLR